MPHLDSFVGSFGSRDNRAIGIIETQNLSPLIIATDEMVKSADVELAGWGLLVVLFVTRLFEEILHPCKLLFQ